MINGQSEISVLSNFHATLLNNDRNIYVYLPPNYQTEVNIHYPVLYMQDGQNVFDDMKSSTGTSWKMQQTLDHLIETGRIRKIIVVAIEYKERSREFSYYTWKQKHVEWNEYAAFDYSIEGKGEAYADFVVNEVKPYIDSHFRTLIDSENTALMGASDGAFITFNIGIRFPEIFGKLGMLSPAFFAMDFDYLMTVSKQPIKLWFDTGEKEYCLLEDTWKMASEMLKKGYTEESDLLYYQVPEGFHSEKDWGDRVEKPLIWFFGNAGTPVKVRLNGRNRIGIQETGVRINPVIFYDSKLSRSSLQAKYIVDDPNILSVEDDGVIIPKKAGTTKVELILGELSVSRIYTVEEGLSSKVKVVFEVDVPQSTPVDAQIGIDTYTPMTLVLKRISTNQFGGEFYLPRGISINYKVKMKHGFQLVTELSREGKKRPFRHLYTDNNIKVKCLVERWEDIRDNQNGS